MQKAKPFSPAQEPDKVTELIEAKDEEALEGLDDDFADDSFLEQYRYADSIFSQRSPGNPAQVLRSRRFDRVQAFKYSKRLQADTIATAESSRGPMSFRQRKQNRTGRVH